MSPLDGHIFELQGFARTHFPISVRLAEIEPMTPDYIIGNLTTELLTTPSET
jgi:hypothetical protein